MTKKNIEKKQWLEAALETLVSKGVEGVKIERLSKRLNTSRSGFYWHFKNREELLQAMIDFWIQKYTRIVTDRSGVSKQDAEKRLLEIMKRVSDENLAKYDLAMFAWAKMDSKAQEAVEQVIKLRCDFIRKIFTDLGFKGDELEMRTRLFVCYHSWESIMFPETSNRKQVQHQKLRYEFFISK